MRLVSDHSSDRPIPDPRLAIEETTTRLREAIALLEAIEAGHLLEELPLGAAGRRHQCAVSLLNVLDRELRAVVAQQDELLEAAPVGRRF